MRWQASKRRSERTTRRTFAKRTRERKRRDKLVTARYGAFAHRSCGRKVRYQTLEAAEIAAMRYSKREAIDMRAYHCDICGGWHVTHAKMHGRGTDADQHA